MTSPLRISKEIQAALAAGAPVVALESTVIAQGLPYPDNLETALAMEEAVRASGATPATIGVVAGKAVIGLSHGEIERFAQGGGVLKLSTRDLPGALAGGRDGATTVAATLTLAHRAGIKVFATGGIGGVHRGAAESFDVSADLAELARRPLAVVSAGAKSILDLPATLETLESLSVTVAGYSTDRFAAFYSRDSGLAAPERVESAGEAAALFQAQRDLGLESALLIANPIPAADELKDCEAWIAQAVEEAKAQGVDGRELTPFLLSRLGELSGGRTLAANKALLLNNAQLAGDIAKAIAQGSE